MSTTHAKRPAVSPEPDTAIVFVVDGQTGLPGDQAKAKLDAFLAKHPLRTIRKGQKGTAELVREARDSRDRR